MSDLGIMAKEGVNEDMEKDSSARRLGLFGGGFPFLGVRVQPSTPLR
jgi:hypothetical protein